MKIGILRIGQTNSQVIGRVQEKLNVIFPKTQCLIIPEILPVPEDAFNESRRQYRSDTILSRVHSHVEKEKNLDRILGIVDIDIFVPNLNFVFGEAECPGKAALISLWRLRPEFYGAPSKTGLFVERIVKEAVHELGHTFGLGHCSNPFCVMFFSNSIFDTDRKKSLFCEKCYLKVQKFVDELGGEP